MAPTVYLVSGANRGIGFGIVKSLLDRPDVIVFAGVRKPAGASDLLSLQSNHSEKLHILPLTSAYRSDNLAAVSEIQRIAGKLDVVIANAGIANFWGSILETPDAAMREHYEVNVIGATVLFQSVWPLLKLSTKPEFAIISSVAGSIAAGASLPAGFFAYGASKAAVDYLAMKLHSEHPELVSVLIHPGPVATDMGANAHKEDPFVRESMPLISVDESVTGILNVVDNAKREPDGPKMIGHDGVVWPW
ncbi:NADP-binding protein [Dacryopinax primogenitus]|uniref:NADP-binding protein n=1 Tax=Dacryopinax primogenitus (strain DJM 731) TaxID=1858805 RepID=M5GAJ4_DACPD|nr:NADP-binding protein [Dacryopinax primogenitus]EJU05874.1 NADP-binding protein [Dacryopinax primogenitus]